MRNITNVTINKAILHVIDNSMEEPVLNQKELELTDEILEFIGKHIAKSSSDESAKYAKFNRDNDIRELCRVGIYEEEKFVEISKKFADIVFKMCKDTGLIPSGDLLVVKFESEYGKMLAVIKMIYNKTFIHQIDYENEKMVIDIKTQYIGLPDTMQRIQKCALINLDYEEGEALVVNRPTKQEKDAKNVDTFINDILKCTFIDDKRDCTKSFTKCSEMWVRENLSEDAGKAEEVRRGLGEVLRGDDVIDIREVAYDALGDESMAESYIEALKEEGLKSEKIEIDKEWVDKKLKRKKLKIDKDIEIHINTDAYNDINRFQVKRNGDGTVDLIVRQVRNYFEK